MSPHWLASSIIVLTSTFASAADIVNGLNAEYFADQNLQRSVVKQIEPNVDHHWGFCKPHPNVGADHYSVRWTGWIKAPVAGRFNLILMGDDGFRLFLDGLPIINEWKGGLQHHSATVELTGKPQALTIEYFDIDRNNWMSFWWQPLGTARPAIVPSDVLFPDEESANSKARKKKTPAQGLIVDYFSVNGKRHHGRGVAHRTEAIWGDWSAHPGMPVDALAKYSGFLVPEKSGRYKLTSYADDRVRVWIDEKPVLEAKFGQQDGFSTSFIELTAGDAYPLSIEFTDSGHWGSYYLHWIPPEGNDELQIPCSSLFPNRQSLPKDIKIHGK